MTNPIETAKTVVIRYKPMVLPPIFESLEISFKSDTPLIKDAKIKGTAINFKRLMKIFPKGFTQSVITCLPQSNCIKTMANKTPKTIPNNICQCNANFLMLQFLLKNVKIHIFF